MPSIVLSSMRRAAEAARNGIWCGRFASQDKLRLRLFLRELLPHEIGERGNRAEGIARGGLVLYLDAEFALQHHHDLQRVDGVEAEAACEERLLVRNVVRGHVFELE